MKKIQEVAAGLGITDEQLIPYGHYKAKVVPYFQEEKIKAGKLILVTSTTPNKAGVGKTTTSIALSLGLNKVGKKSVLALREPSLGPCFGMKGGATGGGKSVVLPQEDINLHFTGDFHAITTANNMLAALVDNYNYFNQGNPKALKKVLWKRVMDINDRAMRNIITGLEGNGIPTETGFDITPASEIMALFCLSVSIDDLRKRIDNILLGYTYENQPCYVRDLQLGGAITALLKDAFQPNMVQDADGNAAFIHGGPFANIAHGCNSLMATKAALQYGDYVVTEAGFGSDLGAEKFLNIKCRIAGLQPALTVLVTTTLSLKLHGGANEKELKLPNMPALKAGMVNLERHYEILKQFGQTVVIAINQHPTDTDEEIQLIADWCAAHGLTYAVHSAFSKGSEGATDLANVVIKAIDENPSQPILHTYDLDDSIEQKLEKIAVKVYNGKGVQLSKKAQTALKKINAMGMNNLPVCVAKTQYSFSADAAAGALATGFTLPVEDLVINSGAGFIVAVCGEMMRMPGLPKVPQAVNIDVVDDTIRGLIDDGPPSKPAIQPERVPGV